MKIRISQNILPGDFQDGQILRNTDVNKIIDVLREGVNNNYDDLIKVIAGGRTVHTFNTVADMEAFTTASENDIAVVFDYSEGEDNEVIALDLYEFDGDEFVAYTDSAISFLDMIDRLIAAETTVSEVETDAAAGAAHAEITNGSNPHATTFANIAAKPTTVAGYGITDAATLVEGTIPAAQLPSYVDDVIEGVWINSTTFTVGGVEITPETGKIYVSTSGDQTHKVFRWTGSQFVEISVSLALGNTSGTAFRGDLGEQAFNNATLAAGWGNHANAGYLTSYTETDPVFTASNAAGITATDKGNWNNAYGWGNHQASGYITSEADPVFTASNAFGITGTDKGNWNNAYNWGDHANAGYASNTAITNAGNWDTAYGWGNHANAGYVANTTNIANLPLTGDISASNLTAELDTATTETKGLMSAEDKENLDALNALMGSDENNVVDRITEVLTIFEDYPEGADLVTALGDKLDADDERIDDWDEAYGWGNHAAAGYANGTNVSNWDEAYGWGNHANAGYADGTNVSNWDTAYGWGNHASVGYLTAEADTLDTVVNRGSVTNNATINYITTTRTDYNTTATDGYTTGQVGWDADLGTLSVGLLNGSTAKVGQQTMYYVQADETLTTGDVVQFNGVAGFKPRVKKAVQSEINNMPSLLMGFVTGNIGTGNLGYVTSFGLVRNINTANFGTAGQILYYDSNTSNAAGKTTTTVPTAPNAKIELAAVVRERTGDASNGELLVRVGTATSLAFDSSVQLSNPATGEVLGYNGTAGRWENVEVSSLGINVALSNVQNGQTFIYDDGIWRNNNLTVYGSVNSVGLNMPTGFTVANSPITDSGTLGVTYAEGYSLPATSTQDTWNSAYGWGNHQAVGYVVGLANGTVTTDNIAAWNGTTGKLLKDTGVAISSLLTSESDPVFTASNAFGITGTDKTNWNSAFAWGNHQASGYATTSYVDGVVGDIETILDDIIGGA